MSDLYASSFDGFELHMNLQSRFYGGVGGSFVLPARNPQIVRTRLRVFVFYGRTDLSVSFCHVYAMSEVTV